MRARRLGHAPPLAATTQVDVAVGTGAAGVRGRAQLAQQAQLLERRLELGAEHAPLDPLERAQRRLDRRPLPLGAEVRAQPRAQVPGPADVEHLVVAVAEEVDARLRRRAGRERSACPRAAAPAARRGRRGPPRVVAPRSCASPISASRISAVASASASARWHGVAEVPKKYASEASPTRRTRPVEQPAGEPDRVDDRRGDPPAGQPLDLAVEEAEVEAGVVGDEHRVARELEEAAHRELDRRRAPQRPRVDPGQRRDRGRQRPPRVDERLEPLLELQRRARAPRRSRRSRTLPGRETGRLQVDDDVRRLLERQRRPRRRRRARRSRHARRGGRRPGRRRRAASARARPARAAARTAPAPRPRPARARAWPATSSTRRSAASNDSCTPASLCEHMFACKREEKAAASASTRAAL